MIADKNIKMKSKLATRIKADLKIYFSVVLFSLFFIYTNSVYGVCGGSLLYEDVSQSQLQEKISQLTDLGNKGDDDAQCRLGVVYFEGHGVDRDYEKGLFWFKKSAEQGNPEAQFMLGEAYFEGKGISSSYSEAMMWLQKAAEQGHIEAQGTVGFMYFRGIGVRQDIKYGLYWFVKAAEQGFLPAQYELGLAYDSGNGVEQEMNKAIFWYTKAADQGSLRAQRRLEEIMRERTDFIEKNKKAIKKTNI